jgi:glycerate 2-kinase
MDLNRIALEIFRATIAAIEVESVVEGAIELRSSELRVVDEVIECRADWRGADWPIVVIAIGKAALPMARGAARALGASLTTGIIATNEESGAVPARFRLFTGGHPVPNQGSLDAAGAVLDLLREVDDDRTLVLFLISGGGSALFEKPVSDALTLEDLREVNRILVGCGAVIGEMNIVRRFLSAVKGGRLAMSAPRARQVTLIVSDVNHDDLATVSSGPTLAGVATRADFERIVARYDLLRHFPPRVVELISSGQLPEMPRRQDPAQGSPNRRTSHLLLDNRAALRIAAGIAEQVHGCVVEIAEDLVEGDVQEMARQHLARLERLRVANPGKTVCLISGGEVICPVRGDGEGGRNQEFVLRAAIDNRLDEVAILSAGTDGIDGHSPAAGAIADQTTLDRAAHLGLSPQVTLDNSDSYRFFAAIGDAIMTGPTGNNVRDLRLLLAR